MDRAKDFQGLIHYLMEMADGVSILPQTGEHVYSRLANVVHSSHSRRATSFVGNTASPIRRIKC